MNTTKKLKTKIVAIIILFLLILITPIFAWRSLTHYYINSQAEPTFGGIFNHYGTAPDMFIYLRKGGKLYYVQSHSPYPRTVQNQVEPKYDYINENNFAYIMQLVAKYPSSKKARALGWGAHIVADWVAHGKYYFTEDNGIENAEESQLDEYVYLKYLKDGIEPTTIQNIYLIRETFFNFIYLQQRELGKSKKEAIEKAYSELPSDSAFKLDARKLSFFIVAEYFEFSRRHNSSSEQEKQEYAEDVNRKLNAEQKLSESINMVKDWTSNPDKYKKGNIPAEYIKTSSPKLKSNYYNIPLTSDLTYDEIEAMIWEEVQKESENAGIVQYNEREYFDENGGNVTEFATNITDEDNFMQIFEQVVNNHIQNPISYKDWKLARWMKRVYIDKVLDVDLILDFDPPLVEILSPSTNDITNANPLTISGTATDKNFSSYKLEYGEGENPTNWIEIRSQKQEVRCQITDNSCEPLGYWDTKNLTGLYTLKLSAIDKNDNENTTTTLVYIGDPIFVREITNLKQPKAVYLDKQNNIYIADTMNNKIVKCKETCSSFITNLKQPTAIYINEENIFVSDTMNYQIKKYDLLGNLLQTIGDKKIFNQPQGIVSDDTNIYVVDTNNNQIKIINSNGTIINTIGSTLQFNKPTAISIDKNKTLYLADTLNNRIQLIDTSANFVDIIPDLFQPEGIFIDTDNNLYISNTKNNEIIKMDKYKNKIFTLGKKGSGTTEFNQPSNLYATENALYITDTYNNRVQIFTTKYATDLPKPKEDPQEEIKKDNLSLKINNLKILPNPITNTTKTSAKLLVEAQGNILYAKIEIYNTSGKQILSTPIFTNQITKGKYKLSSPEVETKLYTLPNGVYFYRVTLNDGVNNVSKVGKLVVLR